MNRLSERPHIIAVNFDDGKVETTLTVKEASSPTPTPGAELVRIPVTSYQIPVTGID
ncbi:MAG: hypothetical protein IKE50_02185 [Erysipelotrichaceae bacterium]|nr:hypothetical protein [Erysipelotrichaceae bacterium]MBR2533575.1 hypothetical protein [Erysipelotrichaceae bacterium]